MVTVIVSLTCLRFFTGFDRNLCRWTAEVWNSVSPSTFPRLLPLNGRGLALLRRLPKCAQIVSCLCPRAEYSQFCHPLQSNAAIEYNVMPPPTAMESCHRQSETKQVSSTPKACGNVYQPVTSGLQVPACRSLDRAPKNEDSIPANAIMCIGDELRIEWEKAAKVHSDPPA